MQKSKGSKRPIYIATVFAGLQDNPHIGANLRLHPGTVVYGFFPPTHPSVPLNPYKGPSISTVITETASLGSSPYMHYGSRIEAHYMFPVMGLGQLPWLSGEQFKQHLARYKSCMAIFSLTRDGRRPHPTVDDPHPAEPILGRVKLDPSSGLPLFSYVSTTEDRESTVEGLVVAAEVLRQAGATEILCSIRMLPAYNYALPGGDVAKDEGLQAPGFRDWIAQLRKFGVQAGYMRMGSAHQMGSNRMGPVMWEDADEQGRHIGGEKPVGAGVVDPEGRVYGVEGLYVSDASVLPGATGVNPMLTIMAVSNYLTERMVGRWEQEGFAGTLSSPD